MCSIKVSHLGGRILINICMFRIMKSRMQTFVFIRVGVGGFNKYLIQKILNWNYGFLD